MKISVYLSIISLAFILSACNNSPIIPEGKFEYAIENTIFSYLADTANDKQYSSFRKIAESGGLKATLSAYNPYGSGYTLFLPDNKAIENFIEVSPQFSTLDDLLKDSLYAKDFCEYHVVDMKIHSNSFPFGAFSEPTLSGDYLTVSFIISSDSSYYKINNYAVVYNTNSEMSNGYIHNIKSVLQPVTYTTYGWLEKNPDCSIFMKAVDLTGFNNTIDFNQKKSNDLLPVTMLVEPDSIYHKSGIYTIKDLIDKVSPGNNNYTSPQNPLYGFVGYHLLSGDYFIDEFVDENTVYSTFSEVPVNINGLGLDIAINKGKKNYDTIIYQSDTTFIDFIKFEYDLCNVLSQTGPIHIINGMMEQMNPPRTNRSFQFGEEPSFTVFRKKKGAFVLEENSLSTIKWSGADLYFVASAEDIPASGDDYLEINGDFTISYTLPKIVQGKYYVYLRAESYSTENAMVEVLIDGKKVGSLVDLTRGGTSSNPYKTFKLGSIEFNKYVEHTVEIRPLIPGRFIWDYIDFRLN